MRRYATFIWDADGDMGDAVVLISNSADKAEAHATAVRDHAEKYGPLSIQAMVIQVATPETHPDVLVDMVVDA